MKVDEKQVIFAAVLIVAIVASFAVMEMSGDVISVSKSSYVNLNLSNVTEIILDGRAWRIGLASMDNAGTGLIRVTDDGGCSFSKKFRDERELLVNGIKIQLKELRESVSLINADALIKVSSSEGVQFTACRPSRDITVGGKTYTVRLGEADSTKAVVVVTTKGTTTSMTVRNGKTKLINGLYVELLDVYGDIDLRGATLKFS